MADFQDSLQAKLERNAALGHARQDAEAKMDEAKAAAEERARQESAAEVRAQRERHAELATHLQSLIDQLEAAGDSSFVVRSGWTASGEEFVAKFTTRGLTPARSLLIELDRDDDEVLARWHSDLGDSLELYHLLEVDGGMLGELVLQLVDQEHWTRADKTPPFPGNSF